MIKNIVTLLALFALLSSSASCEDLKIGGAFALSGGVGGSWGKPELDGATMAVDEINQHGGVLGRQIKFIVEDTQSSLVGTVNSLKKLIELDRVSLIVGPTWLDSYGGAIPIIERSGVPTLTPSAGPHTMNPDRKLASTFTMFPSELGQFREMFEVSKRLGFKSVAYIFDQDPYWATFEELLRTDAPKELHEVTRQVFPIGSTDYRAWLSKFRAAPPDAFIGGFASETAALSFAKQLTELKVPTKVVSVDTLCEFHSNPAFKNVLNGTICIYIADPVNELFSNSYFKRFGIAPTAISSRGYDSVKVIVQAFELANGDPAQTTKFLKNNEFDTVSYGPIKFNDFNGVATGAFLPKKVENNELVPIP